jgi:hypothetical protein
MKNMRLNENKLNQIIKESIEYITLRNQVREVVAEEVKRYVNEKSEEKNVKNKDPEGNATTFRDIVQNGPHSDKYNVADFAREVLSKRYKGNDDTLRSLASKMLRGKREIPSEIAADGMMWVRTK